MNNLVKILNQDGQLVVTSRQIAKDFVKEHPDVTKAIENLIGGIGKTSDTYNHLFIETEYQNEQNKQWYKEYLLTRDGFSLLVMGFTGEKALQWKLKYIEAFNNMEQVLKGQAKQLSTEEILELQYKYTKEVKKEVKELKDDFYDFKDNAPLFNVECKELQALVKKVGTKVLGGYKTPAYRDNSLRGKVYSDIQHQLRREFGVERYEAIKRCQLVTAKKIVSEYKVPIVLAEEIVVANNQITFESEAM